MDPLKAHPTTYATHELEDARARIRRELSRRRAAQVADAAAQAAAAAEDAPDQPAAGPEEQGPGVDAPFQPHEVRYAATIPTRAECSCQGWHWHGDLGAVALNSYAEHLRLAWGC